MTPSSTSLNVEIFIQTDIAYKKLPLIASKQYFFFLLSKSLYKVLKEWQTRFEASMT